LGKQRPRQKKKRPPKRQRRAKAETPKRPARPDTDLHGSEPVVFDATIPDHFALAAALELLSRRYDKCQTYLPNVVRTEIARAASRLPALHDALRAPWLGDFEVTLGDMPLIEQMREDVFGEADPLAGLGECVVIHMASQMGIRAGIEDRAAFALAKRRKVRAFRALHVLQALHRFCGVSKPEARDLYHRLRDGTGAPGTRLISLPNYSDTKLEKYLGQRDENYA
jgi:hypothetical protein